MISVAIVENDAQVSWAIENNIDHLIPVSTAAQFAMLEKKLNTDFYLKLNPDEKTSREFILSGERFANKWFKTWNQDLQIDGVDFGTFCRMHWLFFIPEVLRSYFVILQILKTYHPDKIIIFPKDERLKIVDDHRNLEAFVVRLLKGGLPKQIHVEERQLQTDPMMGRTSFSLSNLKRYFDLFLENPKDLLLAAPIIISQGVFRRQAIIPKVDLVFHTQHHILTDSLPLIKLIKQSGIRFLIVADSLLLLHRIALLKNNIQYLKYEDVNPDEINTSSLTKLGRFWRRLRHSDEYKKLLQNHSLNHLEPVITAQFDALFRDYSRDVLTSLCISKQVLSRSRPKAICLAGNSGRRGLAFAFAAKQFGIKSVLFQHGVDIAPVQSSHVFDFMIVWGKFWREWYRNNMHLPINRFFAAGWFYVDNLVLRIKRHRPQSLRRSRPIVLFVLADYLIDNYKHLAIVSDVITELTNKYYLVIRPHPGQDFPLLSGAEWDLGKDLDEQLIKADLVLTLGTTVGLRAMLWKKPLIHLKIDQVIDDVDFTAFGAANEVVDIKMLANTIDRLLKNAKERQKMLLGQKKFLTDYVGNLDGKPSMRVLNFISAILTTTKPNTI